MGTKKLYCPLTQQEAVQPTNPAARLFTAENHHSCEDTWTGKP